MMLFCSERWSSVWPKTFTGIAHLWHWQQWELAWVFSESTCSKMVLGVLFRRVVFKLLITTGFQDFDASEGACSSESANGDPGKSLSSVFSFVLIVRFALVNLLSEHTASLWEVIFGLSCFQLWRIVNFRLNCFRGRCWGILKPLEHIKLDCILAVTRAGGVQQLLSSGLMLLLPVLSCWLLLLVLSNEFDLLLHFLLEGSLSVDGESLHVKVVNVWVASLSSQLGGLSPVAFVAALVAKVYFVDGAWYFVSEWGEGISSLMVMLCLVGLLSSR